MTLNKNGNRTYKNLWNPVKAVLERKCIGAKANTGKEGKSKTSKLNFLRNLVAKEQIKLIVIYLVWFGGYRGVSMYQTPQNLHLKLVFLIQRKLWLNTVYLENNNKGSNELSTDHNEVTEAKKLVPWPAHRYLKDVPFLDSSHRCHRIPSISPSFLAHHKNLTL